MVKEWNKGFIGKLIEMYRERPCLWQVGHKDYTNNFAKSEAYDEILAEFRNYFPQASLELLKAKIQNLRSSYRKEAKKLERSLSRGDEEVYKPRLWYYDQLSYCMNQDSPRHRPRPRRRYYNSPPDDDDFVNNEKEELSEEELQQCDFMEIVTDEQLRDEEDPFSRELLAKLTQQKEAESDLSKIIVECTSANDECTVFGTYVSQKLRKMDDSQQILAEALIQSVLTKGLKKQLTDSSDLLEMEKVQDLPKSEDEESTIGEIYEYTGSGLSRVKNI